MKITQPALSVSNPSVLLLISFLFILSVPVFANNDATFDTDTGVLFIPRLTLKGDDSGTAYIIDMGYLGGLDFTVSLATEITPPLQFSAEYLQSKTFYFVYFGTGVDGNGDDLENVAVVEETEFADDGTSSTIGLLNGATDSGLTYEVDAQGQLIFDGEEAEVTIITCGGNDQYFKTESFVDGVIDSVDLYFYKVSDAFTFANNLTAPIPRCL